LSSRAATVVAIQWEKIPTISSLEQGYQEEEEKEEEETA
jgi:hypothetical protein